MNRQLLSDSDNNSRIRIRLTSIINVNLWQRNINKTTLTLFFISSFRPGRTHIRSATGLFAMQSVQTEPVWAETWNSEHTQKSCKHYSVLYWICENCINKNSNVLKHGKQRGRVVSAKSRELISKFKINKAFVRSRKLKQIQALLNHT